MRRPVVAPGLGLVEAFTVIRWTRTSGERVAKGETIVAIETEKTEVEIEAPATGRIEIVVQPGPDLVPADAILGYIEETA
jgi:pyruvate/2-oxoglutarate dehydrogenase complex dihydrolipoamide acyltransferase (E2) component